MLEEEFLNFFCATYNWNNYRYNTVLSVIFIINTFSMAFLSLDQGLAIYGPPPVFVYKVLLEHSSVDLFIYFL